MNSNKLIKYTKEELAKQYDDIFKFTNNLTEIPALYSWVLKKLSPTLGSNLLDIGCGRGMLLKIAQELGMNIVGIDFSKAGLEIANQDFSSGFLSVADGERLPFPPESFDYVTNIGSLEHFSNPEIGLQEIVRVLKPKGSTGIILPNSHYLIDIVWHVLRTGYSVNHKQPLEKFATIGEWKEIIERNGLRVNNTHKYNAFFPKTIGDWCWYRKHYRKIASLLLSPMIPFNLSNHFLFICSRSKY